MRKLLFVLLLGLGLASLGCALDKGDSVNCPTCDNVTQLLVGTRCVPLAEVEECGPDGHSHGTACHCFHGQTPTTIGEHGYCLQQGCGGGDQDASEAVTDPDLHACEHLGDVPEQVSAVAAFADFDNAHVEVEHLVEIVLPVNQRGFVHFEGDATGEVAVYVREPGRIDSFLDENEQPLTAENVGGNTDCPADFPEVWHVEIVNDSGQPKPQIIRFKQGVAGPVHLLIVELGDEHE